MSQSIEDILVVLIELANREDQSDEIFGLLYASQTEQYEKGYDNGYEAALAAHGSC